MRRNAPPTWTWVLDAPLTSIERGRLLLVLAYCAAKDANLDLAQTKAEENSVRDQVWVAEVLHRDAAASLGLDLGKELHKAAAPEEGEAGLGARVGPALHSTRATLLVQGHYRAAGLADLGRQQPDLHLQPVVRRILFPHALKG